MEFKAACINGIPYGESFNKKDQISIEEEDFHQKCEKMENVDFKDQRIFDILDNP